MPRRSAFVDVAAVGLLQLLLLLQPPSAVARPDASAVPAFLQQSPAGGGRSLALCERKDDSDSSITKCDDWCKFPEHCAYCKCRQCSLCKACSSDVADDIAWEGCEDWCSVPEHCGSCLATS